jgi:hypothetical protein
MKLKSIPQINTANNKQMLNKDEYFNIYSHFYKQKPRFMYTKNEP